jgi:hypothetical protein
MTGVSALNPSTVQNSAGAPRSLRMPRGPARSSWVSLSRNFLTASSPAPTGLVSADSRARNALRREANTRSPRFHMALIFRFRSSGLACAAEAIARRSDSSRSCTFVSCVNPLNCPCHCAIATRFSALPHSPFSLFAPCSIRREARPQGFSRVS